MKKDEKIIKFLCSCYFFTTLSDNGQLVEIIRIRNYLTHNHKQITKIKQEYTIRSNKSLGFVDNVFLAFNGFLPNLKVNDSEGTEYPIMPNSDLRLLLEAKLDDGEDVKTLLDDINAHKIFVIWIKIPPNKKLSANETRILYVNYENKKIPGKLASNFVFLNVSADLSFPVFWIFEKPKDYDITSQYAYTIIDNKLKNIESWKKSKSFHYDNTVESSGIIVKPESDNVVICYSFRPKPAIVALPAASILLLISFSAFLILIQHMTAGGYEFPSHIKQLLDYKIELSIFVISSSFIIPRFVSNPEIRHNLFWLYFVPVLLTLIFFLMGNA